MTRIIDTITIEVKEPQPFNNHIFTGFYNSCIGSITDYEDELSELDVLKTKFDNKVQAGLTPYEIEHFKTLGLDLTDCLDDTGQVDFELYKDSDAGQPLTELHCYVHNDNLFKSEIIDIYNSVIFPGFVKFIDGWIGHPNNIKSITIDGNFDNGQLYFKGATIKFSSEAMEDIFKRVKKDLFNEVANQSGYYCGSNVYQYRHLEEAPDILIMLDYLFTIYRGGADKCEMANYYDIRDNGDFNMYDYIDKESNQYPLWCTLYELCMDLQAN